MILAPSAPQAGEAQPYNGRAKLNDLAASLSLKIDRLFPIAEGLHVSEFAELQDGALKLTTAGHVFARQYPN